MKQYLERSLSYQEYNALVDAALARGETTGPNQSELFYNFTKLNRARMERLDKTVQLTEAAAKAAADISRPVIFLTLTEGWCGDAAQNIPVIEKFAAAGANITTRYLLRDENLELMDRYLTDGGRAIPKVIILDAETLEEIASWGSRPVPAQQLYIELRDSGMEKMAIAEQLQRWYQNDHTMSLQRELVDLAHAINEKGSAAGV